ncbi:uncharacterized protein LOC131942415 isoform X2 [Physella acuta]|nr:uncharacterized protein LOC131942415 isoform X2 [Physella acuta]
MSSVDNTSSSFRVRSGSHNSPARPRTTENRPNSYCPSDTDKLNSPVNPQESSIRPRTNTGESRKSYSLHEDNLTFKRISSSETSDGHISIVPEGMNPPTSPGQLDEDISVYAQMDIGRSNPSTPPTPSYFQMSIQPLHLQKGESSYLPMSPHPVSPVQEQYMIHHVSAPLPTHAYPEPHHPTPLPTVRECGSNEGYLPMDPSSPVSSTGVPRPEPAVCMLLDDTAGLPPRTYSLGSRPVAKKDSSYIEMGPRSTGNDISRATSAPHIINNHKVRQKTESPSASPLSMSLKSDDSDSFMEYMSMRPRTASDSFNYRQRASSFGMQPPTTCRPRSSSHGQGTRPIIKFGKLKAEQARLAQESYGRSQDSSLHGSFDSLRVSSESLRKSSEGMRKQSGSNASDYADMRGTPSPQLKPVSCELDGYVSMAPGGRRTSPHRARTDSSGSGRRPDRVGSQTEQHGKQSSDYTEMSPANTLASNSGDSYMNMDYTCRPVAPSTGNQQKDSAYMNMDLDSNRSVSMENVDTYMVYEPSHSAGNKQRTGSVGSRDKKVIQPRKPSSMSCSSTSAMIQPTVSTSTRTGGSSDSLRKTSRQASMEKSGSLGKDFRKKSGSMGSRPASYRLPPAADHLIPLKKSAALPAEDLNDEYIEFTPTASKAATPAKLSLFSFSDHSQPLNSPLDAHKPWPIGHHQQQATASFSNMRAPNLAGSVHPTDQSETYIGYQPGPRGKDSKPVAEYMSFEPAPKGKDSKPVAEYMSFEPAPKGKDSKPVAEYMSFEPAPKGKDSKPVAEYMSFEPAPKGKDSKPVAEYMSFEPAPKGKDSKPVAEYMSFEPAPKGKDSKPVAEYMSFEPAPKGKDSKPVAEYMSFEPAPKGKDSKPVAEYMSFEPAPKGKDSKPVAEYMSYEPSPMTGSNKPFSPTPVVSYIQSSGVEKLQVKVIQSGPEPAMSNATQKSHQTNTANGVSFMNSKTGPEPVVSSLLMQSKNKPAAVVSSGGLPSKGQAVPDVATRQQTVDSSAHTKNKTGKPTHAEDNPYLSFDPCVAAEKTMCGGLEKVLDQGKSAQFPVLSVEVGQGNSPQPSKCSGIQHHPHSYQRQNSAPPNTSFCPDSPAACHTSSPTPVEPQCQAGCPAPMESPDWENSVKQPKLTGQENVKRQKHPSGSSAADSQSPARHKHSSGSSQKSNRSSGDCEKGSKPGNTKNKKRMASGEKSPASSMSSRSVEFFCGESGSAFNLESKIIPVEAKIGQSLGDMSEIIEGGRSLPGLVSGLCRPGSTPCMQSLDEVSYKSCDPCVSLVGTCRTRHSISDLGNYQQSETNLSNNNNNTDSCASEPALNYVKVEITSNEGQGDGRNKSRNSSDADEKQPPLSYAQIDFVKSQSLNKTKSLSLGSSGDNFSKS